MVDTIISKSAYLWNLMKLFYIEIYDLLCAKVENIIYEKIKSHFKINPQDFDLNINHYKNQKNEYLESLEIENIIKKINK